MPKLVLIRHGQSKWNLLNIFTGWEDIALSENGEDEARKAGELLKEWSFDFLFTSALIRAIKTADIICQVAGFKKIPTLRDRALNERHYGDLQGQNKAEIGEKFGKDQLHIWRRSFDIPPPNGESLKDTKNRVLPYYKDKIEPLLINGKDVLIVAHGNSLRALVMYLENISKEEIPNMNIPTGLPRFYEMDQNLYITEKGYLDK